jgi:hypothetical protein
MAIDIYYQPIPFPKTGFTLVFIKLPIAQIYTDKKHHLKYWQYFAKDIYQKKMRSKFSRFS